MLRSMVLWILFDESEEHFIHTHDKSLKRSMFFTTGYVWDQYLYSVTTRYREGIIHWGVPPYYHTVPYHYGTLPYYL